MRRPHRRARSEMAVGNVEGLSREHKEYFENRQRATQGSLRQLPPLQLSAARLSREADRRRFTIVCALTLIQGAIQGVLLITGSQAVTVVLGAAATHRALSSVVPRLLPVLALAIGAQISTAVAMVQTAQLSALVGKRCEELVLSASTAADLIEFETPGFSNLLSRGQLGAARSSMLVSGMFQIAGSVFTAGAVIGALLQLQPLLIAFVAITVVPAWLVSTRQSRARFQRSMSLVLNARQKYYLQDVLINRDHAKEIRSFRLSDYLRAQWTRLYDFELESTFSQAKQQARTRLAVMGVEAMISGLAIVFLLERVVQGTAAIGAATAAIYGLLKLRSEVSGLHQGSVSLYECGLYLEAFEELADRASAHTPPNGAALPWELIEVENVSFSYPGADEPSLTDISLAIRRGEVVALVGENGSGKTTLSKLLAHLYAPTSGTIRWDGLDTSAMDPEQVRDQITVIFQDFVRWELTARENITMGRVERAADEAWLVAAGRAAAAASVIESLPKGYDTVLTKTLAEGADLSGGQWQRIALARAFYRDAPFIVLDEPTAALDPRAEADLFDNIRSLYAGRTVLLISHRFSTVRSADRIYVMESGQISESGTHRELMDRSGTYAELFTLQAAAYLDPVN